MHGEYFSLGESATPSELVWSLEISTTDLAVVLAEVGSELLCTAFECFEQPFDSSPTSIWDVLKSKRELPKSRLQLEDAIDEKQSVGDVMFHGQFLQKRFLRTVVRVNNSLT